LNTQLLQATEAYVRDLFQSPEFKTLDYHNLEHTLEVVDAVKHVGKNSDLDESDMEAALLAAWLHDVGYKESLEYHEEASIRMTREFLTSHGISNPRIEKVVGCIEATRIPQNPRNLVEEVVADADLFHLSQEDFESKSERMRQEFEKTSRKKVSKEDWLSQNIQFMKKHNYFTNYGQLILTPRKKTNLKDLKKRSKEEVSEKDYNKIYKKLLKSENKLQQIKEQRPTRGIETMFRITSRNHLDLSSMADNKANIMISVNSIILSILVSVLFRKFEEDPNLIIPGLILTLTCLFTIVFAILATRPNVSKGKFTKEDILNKRTNLLFFGNFHSMDFDMYEWGMREMMRDGDYLYGSMIKDIYFLGAVLGNKYKMLRISYTIFMFGFIISVLAFILSQIKPDWFLPGP